jgi:uncharacterized membrane protein (GlpM family)
MRIPLREKNLIDDSMKKFLLFFLYYALAMFGPVLLYALVAFLVAGDIRNLEGPAGYFFAFGIMISIPYVMYIVGMFYVLMRILLKFDTKESVQTLSME